MMVTTTHYIEGHVVEKYLGIVRGLIVRSPTITQGLSSKLQSYVGGKMKALCEMCDTARQEAYNKMVNHAAGMGATGILSIRFDTSSIEEGTEVFCYGTAVILSSQNNRIVDRSDDNNKKAEPMHIPSSYSERVCGDKEPKIETSLNNPVIPPVIETVEKKEGLKTDIRGEAFAYNPGLFKSGAKSENPGE